ncbi:hypothetical protein Syun_023973 [Stephania yunnanensis]|uniref:Pentatricopeptide repeat-containing protein n=1 Tax=Stephania yunnanensis TaxID=152371 RepID=A0AAP0FDY9_9MAGN
MRLQSYLSKTLSKNSQCQTINQNNLLKHLQDGNNSPQQDNLSEQLSASIINLFICFRQINATVQDNPTGLGAARLRLCYTHSIAALYVFFILFRLAHHYHWANSFLVIIDISSEVRGTKHLTWYITFHHKNIYMPPPRPHPKTFAIVFERYVAAGKPDRAVKVFLSMHKHGCDRNLCAFNMLLDVLCKSKRVEMAFDLFRAFRGRFRADVVSYNIIANGWCLIKRTNRALEVLREMVERGLEPTISTYNLMLKGYFRAGQVKQGWEFFLKMKKRGCEIDVVTYTTVVHGFGVVGEVEKARRVFDDMVKEGCLPSVATYTALIQVLCKKSSVEDALVVFEEMVRKGYVPNTTTYNVVIRGLCHSGKMEKAMELMGRMKDDECEPNIQTYNVVIRYFCDAGEVEKGMELFGKMRSGECLPNLDTYNVLMSAMFVRKKADDLLVAGKLLIEMVDRGFVPRRFIFNRILNGLLLTGNQWFAKEILRLQSQSGRLPRHFKL